MVFAILSSLSCVYSQDLNDTAEELNLYTDELQELEVTNHTDNSNPPVENTLTNEPQNNTDSKAYLILDNDADKEKIYLGDYVTWILSVENKGPDIAKNVKVFNQLPDGLRYIKHTATKGTFNPKTGIWNVGNLSVDEGEVFLKILTQSFSVGEKINKAKLTTDTVNLNENNSYEEEEIDVFERPGTSESNAVYAGSAAAAMPPTANPIALIVISLFMIFITSSKKYE